MTSRSPDQGGDHKVAGTVLTNMAAHFRTKEHLNRYLLILVGVRLGMKAVGGTVNQVKHQRVRW